MKHNSNKVNVGRTIVLVILSILVVSVVVVALYFELPGREQNEALNNGKFVANKFNSKAEIGEVYQKYSKYYLTDGALSFLGGAKKSSVDGAIMKEGVTSDAPAPTNGTDRANSTSKTNVQVDGIDEADIVKVDGKYIYCVAGRNLYIVEADSGVATLRSSVLLENHIDGIYLYGDKIVTVSGDYAYGGRLNRAQSKFYVYDTTDKTAPKLERTVSHDGSIVETRFIDGKLYYVIKFYASGKDSVPTVSDSYAKTSGEMPIDSMYWFDGIPCRWYVTIGVMDILEPDKDAYKSYLGAGSEIYVSHDYIYIAETDSSARYVTNGLRRWYDNKQPLRMRILKFNLSDLSFVSGNAIDGYIYDRYAMDEYDGNLRIATTIEADGKESNKMFVLDASMNILGESACFGEDERIYSVRYNGNTASVVTFRQTDPLFKIDLTDPKNIKVSDGLKKEGVSMYLHYVEGTDYIIGFGRDATEQGSLRGIELVLYDNSGADAVVVDRVVIGKTYAYSEALYNPRAILYDKEYDIFGFPVFAEGVVETESDADKGYYYDESKYCIFGFADGKLELKKEIRHNVNGYDSACEIHRVVRIGDYVYAVSERYISAYDAVNYEESSKLMLNNEFFEVG